MCIIIILLEYLNKYNITHDPIINLKSPKIRKNTINTKTKQD